MEGCWLRGLPMGVLGGTTNCELRTFTQAEWGAFEKPRRSGASSCWLIGGLMPMGIGFSGPTVAVTGP